MMECLGLDHEPEGANFVCSRFPDRWPEDGDWDTWCARCLAELDAQIDATIDRALEMMGAWE